MLRCCQEVEWSTLVHWPHLVTQEGLHILVLAAVPIHTLQERSIANTRISFLPPCNEFNIEALTWSWLAVFEEIQLEQPIKLRLDVSLIRFHCVPFLSRVLYSILLGRLVPFLSFSSRYFCSLFLGSWLNVLTSRRYHLQSVPWNLFPSVQKIQWWHHGRIDPWCHHHHHHHHLASDYVLLCMVQFLQPHKAALHPSQFSLLGNIADWIYHHQLISYLYHHIFV
jgi:hypothetical protein